MRAAVVGAAAVAVAATAFTAPAQAGTRTDDHSATRRAMEANVRAGVPGVTALARDDKGTWKAATGVGDRTTGAPRGTGDRYRVGSITKTFVATVLLQLEAEGRLSLDDKVDRWLPGVVRGNGHDGGKITVRQLLNHTSGIYNYTADEGFGRTYFLHDGFMEHRYDSLAQRDLVRIAMDHRPDFDPGTSWNYSNTNYVLAGMIIEKITGRPYGDAVRERIVKPLGLRSTTVPGNDTGVPRPSSRAYSKLSDDPAATEIYDVTELNPSLASSAGEMISTSKDLTRFYTALLRGQLLPKKQLNEMTTTIEIQPGIGYGLGLMSEKTSCGTEIWGHGGGIHGSSSGAVTTRDGRHALAYNLNGDWAGDSAAIQEAEFCGK
ncbi:serine hydrolase domain-containing protein [Streptomyces sp. NPDC091292]|uniref:serine hydrolase domain-containing protein n=1 Tax=Streptomyces sp. NPDC091292 TaxID=3365991 RepID=UPI00380D436C